MNVELCGKTFTIVTDNDEARVMAIVAFLDERLEGIRAHAPRISNEQLAMLAAFKRSGWF